MPTYYTLRCRICGDVWNPRKGSVAEWEVYHLKKHGLYDKYVKDGNLAEAERLFFESMVWLKKKR